MAYMAMCGWRCDSRTGGVPAAAYVAKRNCTYRCAGCMCKRELHELRAAESRSWGFVGSRTELFLACWCCSKHSSKHCILVHGCLSAVCTHVHVVQIMLVSCKLRIGVYLESYVLQTDIQTPHPCGAQHQWNTKQKYIQTDKMYKTEILFTMSHVLCLEIPYCNCTS